MRTLHAINRHEKLLASGQYTYTQRGQATGKRETWNLHRLPDGSTTLRAEANMDDSERLLVHMLNDPDGQPERLHARYETKSWKAEVQITFYPDFATVSRMLDGETHSQPELELPDGVVVVAPCLASNIIHAYDRQRAGTQTFEVLGLGHMWSSPDEFAPRLDSMQLAYQATKALALADVGSFDARRFTENGMANAYFDMHNILLQRKIDGADMLMTLTHYTRRDT